MAIITLTTDMGLRDFYVGAMKGAILSNYPEANIVDLSHQIQPFYLTEAAFVVKNAYKSFPKGTVHLISVNPSLKGDTRYIATRMDGQYFLSADNGLFSMIFDRQMDEVFGLDRLTWSEVTFPSKEVLVTAACHLAKGGTLEVLGNRVTDQVQRPAMDAYANGTLIRGAIVHIDRYGNAITNIRKELFQTVGKGHRFEIRVQLSGDNFTRISTTYHDVVEGERQAIFGSTGYLELAINSDSARNLMGYVLNRAVTIQFHDQ